MMTSILSEVRRATDDMVIVRFVGDHTGYLAEAEDVINGGWIRATVGRTDRRVAINVDEAYLVEEPPA